MHGLRPTMSPRIRPRIVLLALVIGALCVSTQSALARTAVLSFEIVEPSD